MSATHESGDPHPPTPWAVVRRPYHRRGPIPQRPVGAAEHPPV